MGPALLCLPQHVCDVLLATLQWIAGWINAPLPANQAKEAIKQQRLCLPCSCSIEWHQACMFSHRSLKATCCTCCAPAVHLLCMLRLMPCGHAQPAAACLT